MTRKIIIITTLLLGLIALLAACGGGGGDSPGTIGPAETVERYLTAKVGRDTDTVRALLCSAAEANLERESRAFETVSDARIEGMKCTVTHESDDAATVSCEGRIVASYGMEETEFDLSSYRVVKEDGEWKWCGEGE